MGNPTRSLIEHHLWSSRWNASAKWKTTLFRAARNSRVSRCQPREFEPQRLGRGTGITLASGQAQRGLRSVAAQGLTGDRIVNHMPGGDLVLEWDGQSSVFKTGPAVRVFDTEWHEG